MQKGKSIFRNIVSFYLEGFKTMTYGKTLWMIILLKLFIMFAIFKVFFFKDDLNQRANTNQQKSDYVLEQLIKNN